MRTTQRDMNYTRTVAGRVAASGAVTAGTGFTAINRSAGVYGIRLQPRSAAVLGATANSETANQIAVPAEVANEGVFSVYVTNPTTGAGVEGQFTFTVTVLERR
jgi:hypothetical protein